MYYIYLILFALGGIHLIYIAICFAFKDKQKNVSVTLTTWPSIEHIVCFKNESKFIKAKIQNCYELDYPNIHHTFINDNSTDNTLELIQKNINDQSRVINNDKNLGKNRSQIKGVQLSESGLILFSDANVFIEKDALKKMVASFDDKIGGLTGNVTITTDFKNKEFSGQYWEIEKIIKQYQSRFGSVIGFDGGFYCVKRENYNLKRENELSDFETAFLIFEQGKKTIFVEAAKALEQERRTIESAFKARLRASNRVFWSYCRIFKYVRTLSPSGMIHLCFHKLIRYLFVVSLVFLIPFIVIDLGKSAPLVMLILLIPAVHRFVLESIALCMGGMIALTGKEYRTWTDKK